MQRALIDTSVLFAAGYRRDAAHDDGLAILQGMDGGDLPEAIVLDYVLAETLNGLSVKAGHENAVDFLRRIDTNERFHVERLSADSLATAKSLFERHQALSFVDASLAALGRESGTSYLYAFDDDFDRLEAIERLDTPIDPYAPE